MNSIRKLTEIVEPIFAMEGAGVLLQRSISPHISNRFDPFLLFDHFAFNDPVEGPIRGFPMHPHRGIETVTYILKGSVNHRDSLGNSGLIGPGDVQWMTAGGGILHEEMPRRGPDGSISGFQLWVNLPSVLKMTSPRYQGVNADRIPTVQGKGWQARLVAGRLDQTEGPVTGIAVQPLYMEVSLEKNAAFEQPVPEEHTLLAYIFEGLGSFGGEQIPSVRLAVFGAGDRLEVRTGDSPVRFMLMAGLPFREPIVPYGPFVMNTREEIQQALEDLRNGTFVKS